MCIPKSFLDFYKISQLTRDMIYLVGLYITSSFSPNGYIIILTILYSSNFKHFLFTQMNWNSFVAVVVLALMKFPYVATASSRSLIYTDRHASQRWISDRRVTVWHTNNIHRGNRRGLQIWGYSIICIILHCTVVAVNSLTLSLFKRNAAAVIFCHWMNDVTSSIVALLQSSCWHYYGVINITTVKLFVLHAL